MYVLRCRFTDFHIKQQHALVPLAHLTERSPLMAITTETARAPKSPAGCLSPPSTNKVFCNSLQLAWTQPDRKSNYVMFFIIFRTGFNTIFPEELVEKLSIRGPGRSKQTISLHTTRGHSHSQFLYLFPCCLFYILYLLP